MHFITPSAELITQQPGIIGMKKLCEMVGRVCTHSENRITEDSYIKFLDIQKSHHHMSPFEAGTVYLIITISKDKGLVKFFKDNIFSFTCLYPGEDRAFVTTNYRVIVENDLELIMERYWSEPTDLHIPRICIKSETCIEVYKDLTRHRSHSPMIESTRFCNYIKEKFSKSVGFTLPCWLGYKSGKPEDEKLWVEEKLSVLEQIYFEAQEKWGWDAQRASYFLPQGTKATMYLTAFPQDWEWLLKLRYEEFTGPVRPDVLELATKFKTILEELGFYESGESSGTL